MNILDTDKAGMSVSKYCELFDISRQHGYRLVKRQEIPCIKLGARFIIPMWFVLKQIEDSKQWG